MIDLETLHEFPDAVAEKLHVVESTRLSRNDVGLVVNCPPDRREE